MNPLFKPYTKKESAVVWLSERLRPAALVTLERGGRFPYVSFAASLVDGGFERVDYVGNQGQFAMRGDNVDIWPFKSANPFRVSLFGNDIESICTFDPDTQMPIEDGDMLEILPAGAREGGIDMAAVYHLGIAGGLVASGEMSFPRFPSQVLPGLIAGGRNLIEASLLCRAAEPAARSYSLGDETRYRNRMEEYLEKWARMAGCWMSDPEGELQQSCMTVAEGGRSSVYRDILHSGEKVTKVTELTGSLPEEMDRIAVFNAVFPKTAMRVEGFGRNRRGGFSAVLSQAFVEGAPLDVEEMKTMKDVFVEGLGGGNAVRTSGGEMAVVSARCGLAVRERRRGGSWRIPAPESDRTAVEEIGSIIEKVLPVEVERALFVSRHETKTNMLTSQLDVTGRFDGYFEEAESGTGRKKQFAVCVSHDREKLLRMPCETIFLMLEGEKSIPAKEHDEICYGFGMWIRDKFTAFDIRRGRLGPALPFLETIRRELAKQESERILQGLKKDDLSEKRTKTKSRRRD